MNRTKSLLALVIFIGVILRFAVMPFALHRDFLFIHQYPHLLVHQDVVNIYHYIEENFAASVAIHGWNYYPPLTYLFFAAYQWFIQPIAPTLSAFLNAVNIFDAQGGGFLHEFFLTMRPPNIFWNIFVLKLPFLLFEFLLLFLLVRLRPQKKIALIAYILFHPIIFYATYMFGQLDLLPTTLVVASLIAAFSFPGSRLLRHFVAMILLGLAVGFKTFPIFLFLPAVLLLEKSLWKRLMLLAAGFLPIALLTLPFLSQDLPVWRIWLPPFVFTTGQGGLVGIVKHMLHLGFYAATIVLALRFSGKMNVRIVSGIFLLTFLPIYNFTQFTSLHFVVWAMPFLPLWFNRVRTAYTISWLLFLGLLGFKITNWQHQLGLLTPLNPSLFSQLPSIAQLVSQIISYQWVSSSTYIFYHVFLFLTTLSILFRLVAYEGKEEK